MSASFFDFIASVLLLEDPEGLSEEDRQLRRRFVLKFQQVTGPVTAKGLEDTGFYRFYPLASLNEVGGDPATPGVTVEHFHNRMREQVANWPHTMLATGTHDTKRGEDMRARLNVLSEIPEQWEAKLAVWQRMNAEVRQELDGEAVPDANEEMLIYQTLVGTWPLDDFASESLAAYTKRIVQYLDKALREAKLHTSWTNPYEEYDAAVRQFIERILADPASPFVRDVEELVRTIADPGFTNSLAQTVVKTFAPGVPDFYRGVEFWDFNLVDPDNRRPVDFKARREALTKLDQQYKQNAADTAAELVAAWPDQRIKLFTIWRSLQLRKERPELARGDYLPLECEGPRKAHLIAFARVDNGSWTVCVVPRLTAEAWRGKAATLRKGEFPIADWWRETYVLLPAEAPQQWRHAFGGGQLAATNSSVSNGARFEAAELFRRFPVAVLTAGGGR
jgi:(1->4)-alpha-D-glucan 1-alpha-D-glucosylmutase